MKEGVTEFVISLLLEKINERSLPIRNYYKTVEYLVILKVFTLIDLCYIVGKILSNDVKYKR